jgi:hypothetical protein
MDAQPTSETGQMGPAARMFMEQMARERRSFWGILAVFFLLLAGIGGFILYEVISVSETLKAEDFRTVGLTAKRFTDMRNDLNAQQTALAAQQDADREARETMAMVMQAAREAPAKQVPDALFYAQGEILGLPLNNSTASLLASAATAAKGEDADLINAAMADWRDESVPAGWAKGDPALAKLAQKLASGSARPALGHALLASIAFRKTRIKGANSAWDRGCKEVVEETALAEKSRLKAGVRADADHDGDQVAAGLNLLYWRAQCLRKHSEAKAANAVYKEMIDSPALAQLADTNTFKVQAYHGYGTTLIAMANDPATPADQAKTLRAEAKASLEKSGQLRISEGADESNAFGTTENIGFLILRDDAPDKLVQALDHTQHIDASTASTWNLVVQLAAARSLYAQADKATKAISDKYPKDKLKRIIFETYAKLAQQDPGSLNAEEVSSLIGPDYSQPLAEAEDCIRNSSACYEAHAKAFAARS